MKFNLLIEGSAGQGMDTVCMFLEKVLKKSGLYVFSNKDYMSRVRGGHNFNLIRFGDDGIPIGILYKEEGKPTFNDRHPVLRSGKVMVDRKWSPIDGEKFVEEFI